MHCILPKDPSEPGILYSLTFLHSFNRTEIPYKKEKIVILLPPKLVYPSSDNWFMVDTKPEELTLDTEPGELTLDTEPGEITLDTEPGELKLDTEPGEITLDTEPGELKLHTKPKELKLNKIYSKLPDLARMQLKSSEFEPSNKYPYTDWALYLINKNMQLEEIVDRSQTLSELRLRCNTKTMLVFMPKSYVTGSYSLTYRFTSRHSCASFFQGQKQVQKFWERCCDQIVPVEVLHLLASYQYGGLSVVYNKNHAYAICPHGDSSIACNAVIGDILALKINTKVVQQMVCWILVFFILPLMVSKFVFGTSPTLQKVHNKRE